MTKKLEINMKNNKYKTILAVMAFILTISICAFKSRYGLAWEDEYLYTLGGYRLWQGDALMFNELNVVMFMDIFTFPLVSFYMNTFGSSDGIIYFMRLAYVCFTSIIAITFYIRFRHKGLGALLGAILYLLISVFNTPALSYNTMALGFLILSICALPNKNDHNYLRFFLFGFFYSCATLNYPLLAFGYLVLMIILLCNLKHPYCKKALIGSLCAVVLSIMLFVLFVLSRATLEQIIYAFPLIFAKGQKTFIQNFLANGYHGLLVFGVSVFLMIAHVLYILIKKPAHVDNKKNILIATLVSIVSVLYLVINNYNQLYFSLSLGITIIITYIGIIYYLFNNDVECLIMFVFSFVYFIMVAFSSDAGVGTISNPLILSSMASIILIYNNTYKQKYILLPIIIFYVLFFKVFIVYGGYTKDLKYQVSCGPSKYLYTSDGNLKYYENLWETFDLSKDRQGITNLTVVGNKNYLYFSSGIRINDRFAFFNTRNTKKDHLDDLNKYYRLHNVNNNHILIVNDNQLNINAGDFPGYTIVEENGYYTLLEK